MPQLLRRLTLSIAVVLTLAGCAGEPSRDKAAPEWTVPASTTPASTTPAPVTTVPRAASPTSRPQLPPPPDILPVAERRAAPGLSVTSFDGRTVTLGGFRGKPVVVNFFESW
jgi:hypothetical protein